MQTLLIYILNLAAILQKRQYTLELITFSVMPSEKITKTDTCISRYFLWRISFIPVILYYILGWPHVSSTFIVQNQLRMTLSKKNGYEVFRSVQISSFILSKPCLQMAIEVHHICNIFTYIQSLNEHSWLILHKIL